MFFLLKKRVFSVKLYLFVHLKWAFSKSVSLYLYKLVCYFMVYRNTWLGNGKYFIIDLLLT